VARNSTKTDPSRLARHVEAIAWFLHPELSGFEALRLAVSSRPSRETPHLLNNLRGHASDLADQGVITATKRPLRALGRVVG
jgi:hypothetical protein